MWINDAKAACSVSRNAKSQISMMGCRPWSQHAAHLSYTHLSAGPRYLGHVSVGVVLVQRSPERQITQLRSVGISRALDAHCARCCLRCAGTRLPASQPFQTMNKTPLTSGTRLEGACAANRWKAYAGSCLPLAAGP